MPAMHPQPNPNPRPGPKPYSLLDLSKGLLKQLARLQGIDPYEAKVHCKCKRGDVRRTT